MAGSEYLDLVTETAILRELEPIVAELIDRHIEMSKEWFPHCYVPWERGVYLDVDEEWDPEAFPLPDAVRSSLFVNLLTEDNLPYYHATISTAFAGDQRAWSEWNHRWTAEEARHAMAIRDYLILSKAVDPIVLERARMHQMSTGVTPLLETPVDVLAYASLQELATRIAHRNTGKLLGDESGYSLMGRISSDENLHFLFYRDLMTAVLESEPSLGMLALERQVRDFQMPGTGIPGFKRHARAIAEAGIYDVILHYEQILQPVVVRHFSIETVEGLTGDAERARTALVGHIERVGKIAERQKERRRMQQVRDGEHSEVH